MSIAPLAFGDHHCKHFESIDQASEEVFRLIPGLLDFQFLNRENFQFASSYCSINRLGLAAISAQSSRIHVGHRPEPAIGFALSGGAIFKADRATFSAKPARTAVFVPTGISTDVTADDRSMVIAYVDPFRLKETARTMLGVTSEGFELPTFSNPCELSLRLGDLSFDAVLRNLFSQIDLYAESPAMLGHSGIDDVFYRTVVIAMNHEPFLRQMEMRKVPSDIRRLNRVCEFIMANLHNSITLTVLERTAHMSRRTLNYAFMKAFGMSPMAWVREQRLLAVRARLQSGFVRSVAEALYSCGFTNASLFSASYMRRFGELPSATIKRVKI